MAMLAGRDPAALRVAAAKLAAGELVAFPTETVYGLGARADDDAAVAKIFAAKGRPADHPLIVHVASRETAARFAASWSDAAQRLADAFWPGPLTLILPRRDGIAAAAAGGQPSIGLRWPAHPVAVALLREAAARGVPGVAGPSANRFGRVSPTTAGHVQAEFQGLLPPLTIVDGGPCDVGIESAIVDCTGARPALLRPGQLSRARLQAVLGAELAAPDAQSPRASGTLASHYAPSAPVSLMGRDTLRRRLQALVAEQPGAGQGCPVGVYSRLDPGAAAHWLYRRMPAGAAATAHELFAVLRDFDAAGVAAIWVEQPPSAAAWDGVRDRLRRAATR